jgi:polysaccharide biosynthesis transport protein
MASTVLDFSRETPLQPSGSAGNGVENAKPLFVQYLHILQRRKWLILAVVSAAVLAALVATLLMRPVYTASTRIEISREQKNVTNVAGVESEQVGRDLEFYQTQYSLLEARSLAERVMRRLRLERNDGFWDAHGVEPDTIGEGVTAERRNAAAARDARQKAAIDLLLANVTISPIRGSSLVDLEYSSFSPEISAQVSNTWANEFIAQNVARKFDSTAEARRFLERRLAELRSRVEQSERDLVNYASDKNIVTIGTEGQPGSGQVRERTLAADSVEALNRALVQATADRIAAESRAGGRIGTPSAGNPTLSALREQRDRAAAEHASLLVQFERGYPAARAVEQRVAELDRAIAREESRMRNAAQQEYQSALARERDLQARVQSLSGTLNEQRRASIQYNIFQREADTNRQLYDSLLQRYKEIGVAGVSANNIAVIDPAEPPVVPSSPNLVLNLLIAMLSGALAAVALVFILEQSDEGLRDPTRVSELLGAPLLGSVPKAPIGQSVPELLEDPKSELSEAYLAAHSSLAFTTDHGVPRSIMLVSTQPAEGKSTSSLALAIVLQRLGKRVVLVDADLRNPSLHTTLGLEKGEGLTNILAGEDDWQHLVRKLSNGLHFLSAGPSVPSAAELLSGDRMNRILRRLESEYDHVIVDASPILGLADAPLLSRTVEAVIFVVQTGEVAIRGLRAALARLRAAGAPVVGVILTQFEDRHASYGYGYGYGYSYGANSAPARADG